MKKLRCLIVDDEPLACESLQAMLDLRPDLEVVGMAHRVGSAISLIRETGPDVVFLDIQMPAGGGFEVLRRLESPPAVIFVTAYDQYAIRAFDVNAVDYLLKPVEELRLDSALRRVYDRLARPMPRRRKAGQNLAISDVALLEAGASGSFVAVKDILFIEAQDKYTLVGRAEQNSMLTRQPMREWLHRLPARYFLQVDRGLIINLAQIRAMEFKARGAEVTLGEGKHVLRLARTGAERLRCWARAERIQP